MDLFDTSMESMGKKPVDHLQRSYGTPLENKFGTSQLVVFHSTE